MPLFSKSVHNSILHWMSGENKMNIIEYISVDTVVLLEPLREWPQVWWKTWTLTLSLTTYEANSDADKNVNVIVTQSVFSLAYLAATCTLS